MGLLGCRDEREQRISDVEYISQAVRAKAEECLAAVDDGQSPHCLLHCTQRAKLASQRAGPPAGVGGKGGGAEGGMSHGQMSTEDAGCA